MKIFPILKKVITTIISGGTSAWQPTVKPAIQITQQNSGTLAKPAVNPAVDVDQVPATLLVDQKPAVDVDLLGATGAAHQAQVNPALAVAPTGASGAAHQAQVNPALAVSTLGASGAAVQEPVNPAAAVSLLGASGAAHQAQTNPATALSAVVRDLALPQNPALKIVRTKLDLTKRRGGTGRATTGTWTTPANGEGDHNGTFATCAGSLGGATFTYLLTFGDLATNQDAMVITGLKIHFYSKVTGDTTGLLSSVTLARYVDNSGTTVWQSAAKAGNYDSTAAPDTLNAAAGGTSPVFSWTDFNNSLAKVTVVMAAASVGVTFSLDAIEIEVTGYVINTPKGMAGLYGWYCADELYGPDVIAGKAGSIFDRSGNAHHMRPAAAGNRPTVITGGAGINGKPWLEFDGVDDYAKADGALPAGANGSIFMVCSLDAPSAGGHLWSSSDEASNTRFCRGLFNVDSLLYIQQRDADTGDLVNGDDVLPTATWLILEWHSDGASWSLYRNGDLQALTVSAGANNGDWFGDTSARDNFMLGASTTSAGAGLAPLNGNLAEMVVFDGVTLSADDRQYVRDYLSEKYAIALA